MRIDLITREYPPYVYGGAGVHVTELSKVLARTVDVHIRAFDGPRCASDMGDIPQGVSVHGYSDIAELAEANSAVKTLGVDASIVDDVAGADIVHSHTWYANMAGHWASLLHDIPHVISAHSLEPLRPWKREQLGGGYNLSLWAEKTAYESARKIIAVSHAMKSDILRCYPSIDPDRVEVIHNGIDLQAWKAPSTPEEWEEARTYFASYGLNPDKPTIIFVGRITRQKGVPGLIRALKQVPKDIQVILCAGAPDTPQIAEETRTLVAELRRNRTGVVWIEDHLSHSDILKLEACSTVFVTPSVYEPLGIVNLEAMAVGLPVVGTKTGGIPDCIDDGVTGMLVPIEQLDDGTGTPLYPDVFEADLARALSEICADTERAASMGRAGRERVEQYFSWQAIADKTIALYKSIV